MMHNHFLKANMGLFGLESRCRTIAALIEDNREKEGRIGDLENLCHVKDSCFMEPMSDGMRGTEAR